ncbi:ATP-dependent DNA helicase [Dinghuibacter silviterrae]|uniref:UvrD-like helicase family protein n=1 Tax=Dinghuibacter silviterrae TaxID=1539049 RepID=A0A4R8DFR2_9BACT|nr:AAA family ATPase [Dinghuibacter silviterrae]TDW96178.1 UvrD-like helicase family protein [Dinghuibacter silviterrae]
MPVKVALNDGQKKAFKALQEFIQHPEADTFVLKGYAGTGKTFLMQHLARWLEEKQYKFSLLASTGRAAAVLRGKTGLMTKTVHSHLYQFLEVIEDLPKEASVQLTLKFDPRPPESGKRVYIVDESSMLSDDPPGETELMTFGSGHLLSDFFTHTGSNKVIFVGDPGQLPPVRQTYSPALDLNWLFKQNRTATSETLEKIERTENDLLLLASAIRDMENKVLGLRPKLPATGCKNVEFFPNDEQLLQSYTHRFKELGPHQTIAIARSNKTVGHINEYVRADAFHQSNKNLQTDEILLVTYNNPPVRLTNGDFVTVLQLGTIRVHQGLHFQEVRIKAHLSGEESDLLLSLDILYGDAQNFSKDDQQKLLRDFHRRMKNIGISSNTELFREKMREDRFLNCLRAKYGYAVTCHKAQGGEWDHVYLFLEETMYQMKYPELLKWWYTAVTRAKKKLYLVREKWIQ